MKEKAVALLEELTNAHSVSGHEEEVRAVFARELKPHGALSTDRSGSVFCELEGEGPRVMIAGHMDEIGFLVQSITPDGFLQLQPVGGWWEHVLLAQRVIIRTRSGRKILGVISSKPPHFLPEAVRKQVMSIEQMFVDIGASSYKEAVDVFGIALGDPVAPDSVFTPMDKPGLYLAKAFDNRVGMTGAILAGQMLAGGPRANRTILAGTVQEEVGLRGAKTAANFIKPDVAIVLEGPPADDTPGFARSESQGRLGGGVQIRLYDPTAIMNPRLTELAIRTAQEESIPHQVTVRRSGGTDAGSFHLAQDGIPSIVLGVPARYIHSHNAIIDIDDQLHMTELAVALARRLDAAAVAELTRFL